MTHTCSGCKQTKPVEEFVRHRDSYGLCRLCNRERDARPRNRWSGLKAQCKKAKIHCAISFEFFENIIASPCHYCGGPGPRYGKGMDRINYLGGYTEDNVVPACGICNDLRGVTFTVPEARLLGEAVRVIRENREAKGEPPLLRGLEVKRRWHAAGINPEPSRRGRWNERTKRK